MNAAAPLLEVLKSLQHQRGDVLPFKTHTDFLSWVDKVTPLLAFNIKLQTSFASSANLVDIRTKTPGVGYDVAGVNACIGLISHQAQPRPWQRISVAQTVSEAIVYLQIECGAVVLR